MPIKSLYLKNFRNFKHLLLEFDQKVNLIQAPNGAGKTNILESIYLSVYGKSFRPVSTYKDFFHSGLAIESAEYKDVLIKIERSDFSTQETVINWNNSSFSKTVYYLNEKTNIKRIYNLYPVILFAPNSVNLVSEDPSGRRDDLDQYLSIHISGYSRVLNSYNQSLKNRNTLLKSIREGIAKQSELEFWDKKIAHENCAIFELRREFFNKLNNYGSIYFSRIVVHESLKDKSFSVVYKPSVQPKAGVEYSKLILQKFLENREKEIKAGTTLYGVHRDDYTFLVDDFDLRYIGSRGQQRVAAFIFKIIQISYLINENNIHPVFLVDDILSELDARNKEILISIIKDLETQTIITSPGGVGTDLFDNFRLINLS
ncbi:DNA replication and repair protein RecF [Candidatus Dojkabacteria bacterium]|uniref:DNA replication and repair protein RecF n=1 Tax=Candidatus Dojkabacteria bacterium TaxID=2099670 RepID=A0A3M0Z170_9BACT|nr:MAG: DNA replication and repair protein RecF [Candidatus Dojkabacteria bacterium]